jgi:hypothetical protein
MTFSFMVLEPTIPVDVDKIVMTGMRGVFQLDDAVVKWEPHHSRWYCEYVLEIRVSKKPLQVDGAQPLSDDEQKVDVLS